METLENRTRRGTDARVLLGNELREAMCRFLTGMGLPAVAGLCEDGRCGGIKVAAATSGRDAAWLVKPEAIPLAVPEALQEQARFLAKTAFTEMERMVRKSGSRQYRLVSVEFGVVWRDEQLWLRAPEMKDIHILVGQTFGDGYRFMDDRRVLMKWLERKDVKPCSRRRAA